MQNGFYVYEHIRLDTMKPFYVGKGSGTRAYIKQGRNRYWHRIANKHGYAVNIVAENLDEEIAFLVEIEKIDQLRRLGAELTNMTNGGEGMSGHIQSAETIAKRALSQTGQKRPTVSQKLKGVKKSEEHRFKLSVARTGLKISDEGRKKLSEKRKGTPSPMLGKKHTDESKKKISKAVKGKKNPFYGRTHTPEAVAKIILSNIGKKDSEETRLKKSYARRGEKNPRYGKKLSKEQINQQRATLMARPKVTCPHCHKMMNESNAKRWHFDNCKNRKD